MHITKFITLTAAMSAALLLGCANASQTPENSAAEVNAASGDLLLIGNKGEDTVSFVALSSGEVLAKVDTGGPNPHEIAISPDNQYAAVVNYGANDIDIFNVAERAIVHSYDLGENTRPHGIVWHANGVIYATTEGGESIVMLSAADQWTDRALSSIKTDQVGSHMIAVSSDASRAYTANLGSGTATVINLDAGEVVTHLPAGSAPEGIALTPDDAELWISDRQGNRVYAYDTDNLELLAEFEVGAFPLRLNISPDGTRAVTSNLADGSLTVIDIASKSIERTIEVTGSANSQQVTLLFSEDGEKIYAAQTGVDTIAEIDFESGETLRRLPAGRQGDGLAIVHSGN